MSNLEDRIRALQQREAIPPFDEAIPTDYLGIAPDGTIAWLSLPAALTIGDLDDAATLDGTEYVAIEQNGETVKATTQAIADLGSGGSGGFPITETDLNSVVHTIDVVASDSGGGNNVSTLLTTVDDGTAEITQYARITDAVVGPITAKAAQWHVDATMLGAFGARIDLGSTIGDAGEIIKAEIALQGDSFVDGGTVPDAHFIIQAQTLPPFPPGDPQAFAKLESDGGGDLAIWLGASNDLVGFFGVTPVVQQATPSTIGDVIAILQAFGLAA